MTEEVDKNFRGKRSSRLFKNHKKATRILFVSSIILSFVGYFFYKIKYLYLVMMIIGAIVGIFYLNYVFGMEFTIMVILIVGISTIILSLPILIYLKKKGAFQKKESGENND